MAVIQINAIPCCGQHRLSGLGIAPLALQIIATVILKGVKYRFESAQVAAMEAQAYEEFYRAKEAQISELSLYLGRETDTPYWEWFNILRSLQRIGPPTPPPTDGNANGNGNGDKDKPAIDQQTMTIMIVMGALLVGVVLMTR